MQASRFPLFSQSKWIWPSKTLSKINMLRELLLKHMCFHSQKWSWPVSAQPATQTSPMQLPPLQISPTPTWGLALGSFYLRKLLLLVFLRVFLQTYAVASTQHFLFLIIQKRPWPTEQPKVKFAEEVDTENELDKQGIDFWFSTPACVEGRPRLAQIVQFRSANQVK